MKVMIVFAIGEIVHVLGWLVSRWENCQWPRANSWPTWKHLPLEQWLTSHFINRPVGEREEIRLINTCRNLATDPPFEFKKNKHYTGPIFKYRFTDSVIHLNDEVT